MEDERSPTEIESLDFYIQYDYLSSRDLGSLLTACSRLSDNIYKHYSDTSGAWLVEHPVLELLEIRTGESVKFKLVEGAIPSISTGEDGEIVIGMPKKVGIPLLMVTLLLSAADRAMDMRNEYLDMQIKQIDLQLKRQEIDKIRHGNDGKVDEDLQKQSGAIISSLMASDSFRIVSINGVQIKGPESTVPDPQEKIAR